ncbi:MAG: YfhO family protein [Chloroflexi bacterium]|nr:YfhO family protein [Chloroflexota bacterium]
MPLLIIALIWCAVAYAFSQLHRRGFLKHDCHRDVLALGALALATVGFFWRLLFTANIWMPAGGGDLVSFLYPLYAFAARSFWAGDVPLWNPYLYGGAPFAADNQSALFYPVNLLLFFLKPSLNYRTMELLAVAHFYLAGVCAYFGLRYIGHQPMKRWAALAGAVAFMFSDLFVTHFGNLNMIACAAWLPLVFSLFWRALQEQRNVLAVGAGIFLGIAALAGHIQPLLYIVLALGLCFLYHVYSHRRSGWRALCRIALIFALTLAVAFGVSALTMIPSYEMSRLSLRADLSYTEASQYSLPPVALIGLVVPGIFGRGPGGYWGPWPRVEVGYVGILTLFLAGLALLLRRDRLTLFLAALAALALFLALGNATILHGWLYRFVPGFNLVRAPARFIYLLDFALAALAALGLDMLLCPIPFSHRKAWRNVLRFSPLMVFSMALVTLPLAYATLLYSQDKAPEIFTRLLAGTGGVVFALLFFGCGLALLYLRTKGWAKPATLGWIACFLILVDLASLGAYTELEFNDPTSGFQHPAAIAFLKSDPEYFRIDTRTEVWDVWQPNLSLMHGIFDVWGIYNPLVLADYHRYWEGLGSRSSPLYDFLNAKYVIGHKDVVLDWEKFELAFDADPTVNIYRNKKVLPRAFVVHRSESVSNQEEAFAAIHRGDFHPASTVVVEGGQTLLPDQAGNSEVHIISYSNNEIQLEASTSLPGYLVMSEVYYPGWHVEVDGQTAQLKRANYAFRAVFLPPGVHQVRFYFQPATWKIGLACSLCTWFALAVLAIRSLVIRWRTRKRASTL